jgi:hypothetical protein
VRPRPIAFVFAVLVSTAACETSTDPIIGITGNPGGAVTQAEASGSWSFTLRKTTTLPCTGGSLADGQVILATLDVQTDGTVSATSRWGTSPSTSTGPVTGTVTLSTGHAVLTLAAGVGNTSAMDLVGDMGPSGSFSGTVTDPRAGFTPMFSSGGCEYTANGTKV